MKRIRLFFTFLFCLTSLCLYAQTEDEVQQLQDATRTEYHNGNLAGAIELCKQEIEVRKALRQTYNEIGNAIHNLAIYYSYAGEWETAIETEKQALEFYHKMAKEDKNLISTSYSSIAAYYYSRGQGNDYDQALLYGEKAIEKASKNTENYVNTVNMLTVLYSQRGENDKAAALSKNIFKMGRKVFGENNARYANILANHSLHLAKSGNDAKAITFASEAISIYEASTDTMNIFFAKLLTNTANIHSNKEDYAQTIQMLERASLILRKIEGESGSNYLQCRGDLSAAYARLGNLEKSNDILYSLNQSDENQSLNSALSYTKQAQTYAATGNYTKAIEVIRKAIVLFEQNNDSVNAASSYITLSSYYHHNRQTRLAEETCKKVINVINFSQYKDVLARAYNNMAIFSRAKNDTSMSLEYSKMAVACYNAIGDTLTINYADILGNLALYYFENEKTDSALVYALYSHKLKSDLLGSQHPDNALSLYNIANYYFKQGDYEKTQEYFHQALTLQSSIVKKNFTHLTTNGRENYWNTKKYLYEMASAFVYQAEPSDSLILNDSYNVQLFTKGILLNSEIDFKSLLQRSGDKALLEKYNSLSTLEKRIEDLYNESTEEASRQADELKRKAIVLERELMRESKEYGDYTTNMEIYSVDIASHLQPNEVAIEFLETPTVTGATAYFALYLRKGWKVPRKVRLFTSDNLHGIKQGNNDFYNLLKTSEGINYIFSDATLGQLVWQPLINSWNQDAETEPVTHVYFSPVGIFYQWGIEYLKINASDSFCDQYQVYRLSSTKQLVSRHEEIPISSATLFGDIDYYLTPGAMRILHNNGDIDYKATYMTYDVDHDRKITTEPEGGANESQAFLAIENDADNRTQSISKDIEPLPATGVEVDVIGEELMQKNILTDIVVRQDATEECFKALSGKEKSLVHIATHGFSFKEGSAERKGLSQLMGWKNSQLENSMYYSGLLFAGANNIFGKHIPIPSDIEDGVLTAAEISALDFRGLSMVVLSACETAMGDVKDDGVFGLQRGFKKAGAHTLLMSLWNVNDNATRIMMTSFYTALMNGNSRHDAFKYAREQVRNNPQFNAPHYWASFIMLDDL